MSYQKEESKKNHFTEQSFEYGGMHFIPYSKLGKFNCLSELLLRSDSLLGFHDYDYPEKGQPSKFPYSHKSFYEAVNNSPMDIFRCVENGKLYIPCEHELFIYEGKRNSSDKLEKQR